MGGAGGAVRLAIALTAFLSRVSSVPWIGPSFSDAMMAAAVPA
jgi:hypothetical protein